MTQWAQWDTITGLVSGGFFGDGVGDQLATTEHDWQDQLPTYVMESAEGVTTFGGDGGGQGTEEHAARFLTEQLERISESPGDVQPTG